jgi:hypothetical protein
LLTESEKDDYFRELYNDYSSLHDQFKVRSGVSLGMMAIGLGTSTVGVIQLIGKPADVAMDFGFRDGLATVSFQVRR